METNHSRFGRLLVAALALVLASGFQAQAQRTTTGGRQQGITRGTGTTGGARALGGGAGAGSARQYYPSGTVGEAIVTADPETRRLIVITDEETSQFVSQVITNLDQPKPQVLIKVVFMEVTYRNASDIGIEAGMRKRVHDSQNNPTDAAGGNIFGLSGLGNSATNQLLNSFGLPLTALAPIPPGAGLYQVLSSDFQATLRAIAQNGKSQILSRPSILTRNNQQATISLGQEVPLITNTRFDAVNGQINTVTYQNVGIILRVTPFITDDGKVEMIVSPETSELADRSQWVSIGAGVSAPVINSRVADTVVVIPDGQTAVIGGLMSNGKSESENKIPILGDIPGLGMLFKRKIKDNTKTELVIFLTPQIVRDSTQLASVSTTEREKADLQKKTFSEEDLNKFLEGVPVKEEPSPKKSRK